MKVFFSFHLIDCLAYASVSCGNQGGGTSVLQAFLCSESPFPGSVLGLDVHLWGLREPFAHRDPHLHRCKVRCYGHWKAEFRKELIAV